MLSAKYYNCTGAGCFLRAHYRTKNSRPQHTEVRFCQGFDVAPDDGISGVLALPNQDIPVLELPVFASTLPPNYALILVSNQTLQYASESRAQVLRVQTWMILATCKQAMR